MSLSGHRKQTRGRAECRYFSVFPSLECIFDGQQEYNKFGLEAAAGAFFFSFLAFSSQQLAMVSGR